MMTTMLATQLSPTIVLWIALFLSAAMIVSAGSYLMFEELMMGLERVRQRPISLFSLRIPGRD